MLGGRRAVVPVAWWRRRRRVSVPPASTERPKSDATDIASSNPNDYTLPTKRVNLFFLGPVQLLPDRNRHLLIVSERQHLVTR